MNARTEPIDVDAVRADFPCLDQQIEGRPLAYLDNAATSQVPRPVVDAIVRYHTRDRSNIHRGVHTLSQRASADYDAVREKVRRFINAREEREIVFVRGTTEAINLVATTFGQRLGPGDEILVTALEHHANIVPWQMLRDRVGVVIRVVPMDDRGVLDQQAYARLLTDRTRLVALTHTSNALGTVNPAAAMIALAHERGVPVLVDGAQAVPHAPVDVQALDADFFAFSGHKMCGPSGVGVLYGKADLLESLPPYQGGGDMILSVSFEKTVYNEVPARFEAGTPNIAGVIGLGAAIDYLEGLGMDRIAAREAELLAYGTEALGSVDGVRLVGTAPDKASVLSFVLDDLHPHDVGTILDKLGVAVRTGHHCAQPVMDRFGIPATVRASLAFYNTHAEIDALVAGLHKVRMMFA